MTTATEAFDLDEAVAVLSRTPATLSAMLRDLPAGWLDADEGPETWSPRTIVGHLVHGEDADWIPRARLILEHGEKKTFEPYDRFAQFRLYAGRDVSELLDLFAVRRRENLAALAAMKLTPEKLKLTGTHPEFGAVTMSQLLATWVAHDLGHVVQIARVMAKRYKGAIGPWTAYLSVMTKP